ncbi:MAG TPA: DUF58 domain-containing protein [Geminicoccaceae bacterium]|nr:DUF58 domain-containing protein [Geminicoccaceae bacterium]
MAIAAGATGDVGPLRHDAEQLADRLPPLLVAAERVASTVAQGVHGRRRVGIGETFWQFRPYQQGDSSSRIDWRQSARATQLFLRDQEWEAAESVWLWADLSASMAWRSRPEWPTKQDRAMLLVLALASLLTRGGERVAWLGTGRRPLGGRAGMTSLCESLAGPASAASLPPAQLLPRHARLVVVGDLFVPLEALHERLRGFVARGVRGHLLQVTDPAEWSLPFAGRVQFEDLESDGRALIGNVDGIRERYRARLEAHVAGLHDLCRSLSWTLAGHRIDQPPEPALLALYTVLSTRGQG